MSCQYADHGGSYVLGALSPAERLEFEQHLGRCDDCARSVRELAGLPGLLARVDPAVLEPPPAEERVPDTLLPRLVREVRRSRTRRLRVTAGVGAAAAAVVIATVAVGILQDRGETAAQPPTGTNQTAGQAMAPIGDVPVRADLVLEQVTWGTRLALTCTYADGSSEYDLPRRVTYALLVLTRDGRTEQVGTWSAMEGRTMRLTAGTATSREDISSVEVRTADGRAVLKLTS